MDALYSISLWAVLSSIVMYGRLKGLKLATYDVVDVASGHGMIILTS